MLWLAYRRLSWERELVCDEAVVEHRGERRVEYADCLATLARWWFQGNEGITAIDFASSPSLIATRVRALLREPIAHSPLRIVATSALTASTLKFPQEPNPRGVHTKTTTTIATLLLLACCCRSPMFAQATDSSSEAELGAAMAERMKANVEGDTEKIASSLADEYLQTDIYGYVQDKTAWLNEYFKPPAELIKAGKFRWETFDEKDVRIRAYGDSAVVIGTLDAKGTGARPDRARHTWVADPSASFSGTLRFTRVYIKRNGKWLLAALHNAVPLPPTAAAK